VNGRIIAIIPARGGSKGISWKNLRKLNGKGLLYYAIKEAAKSKWIDRIVVSTDSPRIAREAKRHGAEVPFLRPKDMATDRSPVRDAIIHALDYFKTQEGAEYDIFVLLQPTSPLRKARHIDMAIEKLLRKGCDSVISVSPVREHPVRMLELDKDKIKRFVLKSKRGLRRQDLPPVYKVDGSVYVRGVKSFRKSGKLITKDTRAIVLGWDESVDIDDEIDLALAKILMRTGRR